MVMPLPAHLRLPSPTSKRAPTAGGSSPHASHPRSPVKKHLREAADVPIKSLAAVASSAKVGSPQKLKATVARNVVGGGASVDAVDSVVATSSRGASSTRGRLRAATLQAVLGLMDRDDEALQQLLPLLHTLGSLPLDVDSVRRACHAALRQVELCAASGGKMATTTVSTSRSATATATATAAPGTRRDSGRAKSSVSLKHCKAFLLACANEIHELEEVNPCFDYAEETNSEMAAVMARGSSSSPPQQQQTRRSRHASSRKTTKQQAAFDYASLADSSSSVDTMMRRLRRDDDDDGDGDDDGDDDDARADTGSQLTELLCRTAEAEKDDREAAAALSLSLSDRVACRRVFHAWSGQRPTARGSDGATLFRAFAALKKHREASTLSVARKQRAFRRLRGLVCARQPPQPPQHDAVPRERRPTTTLRARVAALLIVHWDLALLLLVACVVQFGLQHY